MIPQAQREQSIDPTESARPWPLAARIAFRFGFCYFVLFIYPSVLGGRSAVPVDQNNPLRKLWDWMVPWVGTQILHLPGPFTPTWTGSGDQLYDYINWLCLAVVAAVLAAIWSLVDRNRKQYDVLYEWLRVFVRLTVAIAMINYGMAKLFRFQFPQLGLAKLVDTYGQSSPQTLLWSFMEYSRGYSFAGGVGEFVGGVLLVIPRFTSIGTLITLGMMSNIFMLNVFYDVPRKIFCIHLLVMCLFLLTPDLRRIMGFFLLNQKEQLAAPRPLFQDKGFNYAALVFQLAIGLGAVFFCGHHFYQQAAKQAAQIEAPIRGIWYVEQFDFDGAPRPPLVTDRDRWQRIIFDRPELLTIQLMDDTQQDLYLQRNQHDFSLWGKEDHLKKGTFVLQDPQPDQMLFSGEVGGHSITARLRRVDLSDPTKFFLTNRGFHWVDPTMLQR